MFLSGNRNHYLSKAEVLANNSPIENVVVIALSNKVQLGDWSENHWVIRFELGRGVTIQANMKSDPTRQFGVLEWTKHEIAYWDIASEQAWTYRALRGLRVSDVARHIYGMKRDRFAFAYSLFGIRHWMQVNPPPPVSSSLLLTHV